MLIERANNSLEYRNYCKYICNKDSWANKIYAIIAEGLMKVVDIRSILKPKSIYGDKSLTNS